MKHTHIRNLLMACALLLPAGSRLRASVFEDYLVGWWTFQNERLESRVGDLAFKEGNFGMNSTISFGKDTVILGKGKQLTSPELNSETYPNLRKGSTLWLRFRLMEEPARTCFLAGFTDRKKPGDWPNLIFGISYYREEGQPGKGLIVLARTEGEESPIVLGSPVSVRPGETLTVAAIFDSKDQVLTLIVNGQPYQKRHHAKLGDLREFLNFGVGRLKDAAAAIIEVEEVRVYSTAISPAWINDIKPDSSNR